MTRLPVLLLGGAETALGVGRSLGRAGVPVFAFGSRHDPISYSRYCREFFVDPVGRDPQDAWRRLLDEPRPGLLIPVSDQGVEFVARNRAELEARGYGLLTGQDDAALAMLDKGATYAIASAAAIATPRAAVMRHRDDLESSIRDFAFPCAIKPLAGHIFRQQTGVLQKVIPVATADALRDLAGPWLDAGLELMLTEIIPGADDHLYALFTYIDGDGKPAFSFTNRKLRQDPPHFGVACYIEQADCPEVIDLGLRFAREAGLRGLAHIEFKLDPRDGSFKLIECNPRFYLSTQLVIASGLDVPTFVYRHFLGEAVDPPVLRRAGCRLWHPVPDGRSLREQRKAGELTVWAWVRSLLHRQHFAVFAADDPWPSIVVNARTVLRVAGKYLRGHLSRA